MIDKQKIKELYNDPTSEYYHYQVKIARDFGVSRQRIHQLVTGYKTLGSNLTKKTKKAWKPICTRCNTQPSVAIHHLDGDHKNNDVSNLRAVCSKCHGQYHRGGRHLTRFTSAPCKGCERILGVNGLRHMGNGFCTRCTGRIASGIQDLKSTLNLKRGSHCEDCGIAFSIRPHAGKRMCARCYPKWRYRNDPVFRKRFQDNQKRYISNNRSRVSELRRKYYQARKERCKVYSRRNGEAKLTP